MWHSSKILFPQTGFFVSGRSWGIRYARRTLMGTPSSGICIPLGHPCRCGVPRVGIGPVQEGSWGSQKLLFTSPRKFGGDGRAGGRSPATPSLEVGFLRNLPLPGHRRWRRRRRKPSGFRTSRIAPRPMAGCSRSGSDEPSLPQEPPS